MAKKFNYRGGRSAESIKRRAAESGRDFDNVFNEDIKMFKPAEGDNVIRILPPTWGINPYSDKQLEEFSEEGLARLEEEQERYGDGWDVVAYIHYGVGADGGTYLCREKMLGEYCPICAAKERAADPDEAKALEPTKRALVWVVDREKEQEGPQLWSMPFSKIRNEIYARSIDRRDGTPLLVDDPEEGFDIMFNRSGTKDRTNYTAVEVDRDPSPIHDKEKRQQEWLDYIMDHPIPSLLKFYDPEHIEKVLVGRSSSRRDDDEDAGDDRPRGRSRFRRRDRSDDTERDWQEDGDGDADDEEDDRPRSRRRRRSDDDDDDGSDRKSSRRRRARSDDDEDADVGGSSRRRRGRSKDREEPDDEDDAEEDRKPSRRRTRSRSDNDEDADDEGSADGDDREEDDDDPSSQAKSRLRRMSKGKSRRSRR